VTKKLYEASIIQGMAGPEYLVLGIKNSNTIHYGQGVPANGALCGAQIYAHRAILLPGTRHRVCCECIQAIFKRRSRGQNTRNTAHA
jgi:hypothetical protein